METRFAHVLNHPGCVFSACLILVLCSCENSQALPLPGRDPVADKEDPTGETRVSRGVAFPAGHRKMLAVLEDIKNRASEEYQYFGRKVHLHRRQALEALGPDADKLERLAALNLAGLTSLDFEEFPHTAIEYLTEANELLPQVIFPDPDMKIQAYNGIKFSLGLAYLRLGETENCCLRHSGDSCILPIQGGGLHSLEKGSRYAIRYFTEMLEADAISARQRKGGKWHAAAQWLLNIAYMTLGEYPDRVPEQYLIPPGFFQSEVEFPRFENVAPRLAMNTYNHAGGAIVDDFNNDDYLDVFVTSSAPTGQTRFFLNNRDGTFRERTRGAGLAGIYGGLNMVQADYDNDGNLDVFIVRGAWHGKMGRHPNSLLRNNGNGTFADVTFDAGLGEVHYPVKTAAWADYDNDGDLDLFVANESSRTTGPQWTPRGMRAPSQLFRNNGDGTFTDVAESAGVDIHTFAMGTVWGDYDNDGFPDLYVAGRSRNALFHNNRDGTFTDVSSKVMKTRPQFPFPVWFWDFDNDGALDLFVSSTSGNVGVISLDSVGERIDLAQGILQVTGSIGSGNNPLTRRFEFPALWRGDGRGGFADVASEQNLAYPAAPMGANFGDLNGDGYLDFYLATGDVPYWALRPNVMFLNQGGSRFANVTMGGGFGHLQKGHGVSFADIDNDGDQDVYVQMGGQLTGDKYNDALFENPGFGHRWITLKLVGRNSNRSAIGARIHVEILENGKTRSIYRRVSSGGSFGCNPLRQNIGLGNATRIESIEVYWPTSDLTQRFLDVEMDQSIEIVEGDKEYRTISLHSYALGGG